MTAGHDGVGCFRHRCGPCRPGDAHSSHSHRIPWPHRSASRNESHIGGSCHPLASGHRGGAPGMGGVLSRFGVLTVLSSLFLLAFRFSGENLFAGGLGLRHWFLRGGKSHPVFHPDCDLPGTRLPSGGTAGCGGAASVEFCSGAARKNSCQPAFPMERIMRQKLHCTLNLGHHSLAETDQYGEVRRHCIHCGKYAHSGVGRLSARDRPAEPGDDPFPRSMF